MRLFLVLHMEQNLTHVINNLNRKAHKKQLVIIKYIHVSTYISRPSETTGGSHGHRLLADVWIPSALTLMSDLITIP